VQDAQTEADAKALNKTFDNKAQAHFATTIAQGRDQQATLDRSLGRLGGGTQGLGVSALATSDGVAAPASGPQFLQNLWVASGANEQPQEANSQQALGAFQPLLALLGKPQAGATDSGLSLGAGHLPLTPLAGQAQLVPLALNSAFMSLPVHPDAAAHVARWIAQANGAAAPATGDATANGQPDPQIVQRVAFVQRISAMMSKTFQAQLDPATVTATATSLGQKASGVLEPFAAQMPMLTQAVQQAYASMKTTGTVEVPGQALSMIESAVGAAFTQSSAFAGAVKANSGQIAQVLQKHLDGDTTAIANAPPALQKLVTGVMSWNQRHGDGTFPQTSASPATLGSAATTGSPAAASSADTIAGASFSTDGSGAVDMSGTGTGSPVDGSVNFGTMDINSLIFMVMSKAADENTYELEDSMNDLQQNTLNKEAARKKQEAQQQQQTAMKQQIDNEYYSLEAQKEILPTVQLSDWENYRQVSWGDGQCNPDGSYVGPTAQLPPLPDPLPAIFTTPPPPAGQTTSTTTAASYGLSDAQLQDLTDVFNSLSPAPASSVDAWLQGAPPTGLGMTYPITTVLEATQNLQAAVNYLSPSGGAPAGTVAPAAGSTPATGTVTSADLQPGGTLYGELQNYVECEVLTKMGVSLDVDSDAAAIADINKKLAADPTLAPQVSTVLTTLFTQATAALGKVVESHKLYLSTGVTAAAGPTGSHNMAFYPNIGAHSWGDYLNNDNWVPGRSGAFGATDANGIKDTGNWNWSPSGMQAKFGLANNDGKTFDTGTWTYSLGAGDVNADPTSDAGILGMVSALQDKMSSASVPASISFPLIDTAYNAFSTDLNSSIAPGTVPSDFTSGGIVGLTASTGAPVTPVATAPVVNTDALKSEFTSAFGDSSQLTFLQGLPDSLPKNANGEPIDPGTLGPNQEAIIAQLVSTGALTLGVDDQTLEARQLSQGNQADYQAYLTSINETPATALNNTGTLAAMANSVSAAQDDVDSLGDMGDSMQMEVQVQMDKYSQIMEALSNIMKKMADTSQSIIENMK
jgi:hypothetical protein